MRRHHEAGNPTTSLFRRLTTLTIKTLFLLLQENFLYLNLCLLPSLGTPEKSLAPVLSPTTTPAKTPSLQSIPSPGRNPSGMVGKARDGVSSPPQLSGGWARSRERREARYPHANSLIIVIIRCRRVQNIISTQTSSSFCTTPPLSPQPPLLRALPSHQLPTHVCQPQGKDSLLPSPGQERRILFAKL